MTAHEPVSKSLREHDAAIYLGVTVSFLRASRLEKRRTDGPPYVKLGRAVRYLVPDLDSWLEERRVTASASPIAEGARLSHIAAEAMAAVG